MVVSPNIYFRTQASKLGLLSKLEKAGLTLKDVEKLLPLGERQATSRPRLNRFTNISQHPPSMEVASAVTSFVPNKYPLVLGIFP